METRTKPTASTLTREDIHTSITSPISCVRVSHYPALSWHELGTVLGKNNITSVNEAATVYKSAARIIELPDQTTIYKQSQHTLFAVKLKTFSKKKDAENFLAKNILASRIPYTKIKPTTLLELNGGGFAVPTVMAELKGHTLAHILFEDGAEYTKQRKLTIPVAVRLQIMLGAALSIQEIHASGLLHCDLTPANVMVDRSVSPPVVKAFDFDHCKLADIVHYDSVGTPLFMPPEAFYRQNKTYKSDVYGLAWLFYLLLGGKMPVMINIHDAERVATSYKPEKLFSGIEQELDDREKEMLAELLVAMFQCDPAQRCDLQYCVDVVETVMLTLILQLYPLNQRTMLHQSYYLGKSLRDVLVNVAFAVKIAEQPSFDVVAEFNRALSSLPASPIALPVFLLALRVDMLTGLTSVDEITQKVQATLVVFSGHYQEIKQLHEEVDNAYAVLDKRPGKNIADLKNIRDSLNYLLKYYEPFSWSLDSLALIDRKLEKLLVRAQPILASARQEVAMVRQEESTRSAEWIQFMIERRDVQLRLSSQGVTADAVEPPNGKRKML